VVHLRPGRSVLVAASLVYAAVLVAATTLPLPSSDEVACQSPASSQWLMAPGDMLAEATRAVQQTGLLSPTTRYELGLALGNILLFAPLGLLVAIGARRGPIVTAVLAVGASMALETLQLTGLLGLYPCAYRQADLDDVLMNTVGALLGWVIGAVLRAPGDGIEPSLTDSKSAVLPLDDPGPAQPSAHAEP
jgi:glycopeptide antibiotics resistance protein